ncbi:MAG: 50S ribosomal protein L4 [Nitrospirae bacterium]|nr:50S ribosomal protein L4 [Nitrospirota bacterium]
MQAENITIEIKDINNKVKGTMTLDGTVFGKEACDSVVHSSVVTYLANQRQGTHATKTRGQVSGGGKKPWKQKHTGRARQGSTRAAQWRGGGIIFGPQPRDYSSKLPKQMRKVALYKALTMKLADGQVVLLDALKLEKPRTKDMIQVLQNLGLADKTVLFVLPENDKTITISARNIPGVDVIRAADLNAYAVAAYDNVVFTADALAKLPTSPKSQGLSGAEGK